MDFLDKDNLHEGNEAMAAKRLLVFMIVSLVPVFTAHGAVLQLQKPDFIFSGFGTLGYALLDDPGAEFRTGVAVDGADDRGSFEVDTRLGLQMDTVFTDHISSTFQTVVREDEDGEPGIDLELGFLRWLATDDLAIRAGRLSLPVYSTSDYREVGYALSYLRPFPDLFAMIPLRRFNGADITIDHEWRDTLFSAAFMIGQTREKVLNDLTLDANQIVGISLTVEKGPARLRTTHFNSRIRVEDELGDAGLVAITAGLNQILTAASPLAPVFGPVARDFSTARADLGFSTIALDLEFSEVFIDAEYTRRRVDGWISDVDGWSFAIGTWLGRFQPYVFLSSLSEKDGDRRIDLVTGDVGIDNLIDSINNFFYRPQDQSTVGIGARYDLSNNMALKAQVERIERDATGISFDRPLVDNLTDRGNDVSLFSVVLDVVF